jgi:para-aminobenzoate synthetase component I
MNNLIAQMNDYGKKRIPFFFIINYDKTNHWIGSAQEALEQKIYFSFPHFANHVLQNTTTPIAIIPSPILFADFKKSFDMIQHHIKYGNTFLCNLTASTPIKIDADLQTIFTTAKAKYKVLFKDNWTCFSPEIFVQIKKNIISTYPMKGTIDASLPNANEQILQDPKEKAEHYTIVDLMRNDLSMIVKNVTVKKFRYTDKIATQSKDLLQISSEIAGELADDWHENIGNIITNLLPAGSISGAPKQKTIEIIAEAETHQRGYYSGIAGYYDGENLDSCVLIRFLENTENGMVYKSGGGITCNSIADLEYAELIQKIYIPV